MIYFHSASPYYCLRIYFDDRFDGSDERFDRNDGTQCYAYKRFNIFIDDIWLFNSNQSIRSLVIQGYLNGKTRDQIALDVGISGGKVSGIIKEWITEIGKPNVEDLRDFAATVRKSGISVMECAEGYRMIKLMRSLGINGETDGYGSSGNENDRDANKEIISFLEEIYMNCKKSGISPSIVFSWIRDLFDSFGNSHNNNNHHNSLTCANNGDGQDYHMEDEEHWHQQQWLDTNKPNIQNSPMRTGIPLISRVSHYITQKKKENRMLVENKQDLLKETDDIYTKKDKAVQNLNEIVQKEKSIMGYIKWYYGLKRVLWDLYGIKIDEVKDFAKVMHDFKTLGFDAFRIYSLYNSALSLRQEVKDNERRNKELYDQRTNLHRTVLTLQAQLSMHRQTLNAFSELKAIGFGLKELKQLRLTVLEISEANHIPEDQAVRKFLKDVDEQYDRKLGFEKEEEAEASEVQSLKNQLIQYRFALQATPYVGPALTNLFQNGVSEHDIIEINQLVRDFRNNIIPLDCYSDGKDTKHDKDNKPNGKWSCRSLIDA